tara:strand:+ start:68 stop:304 length:237 start_codon:yes stop_codon:yes gene_type:complete
MTDPKDPKKKKKKDDNNPYSLKNVQKSYPNAIAVYPRKNSLGSKVMFKGGGTVNLKRGRYKQKQESLASAIDKVINKK